MRHVDEGLLHAYIDGALEAGTAERAQIESHLAACADCRVRLDDARRVRDVAQVALDAAAPAQAPAPSWEVIVAERARRGSAGAPPARARPRIPLAWAASLVLAIGAGWMARAMVAERALAPELAESDAVAPSVSAEPDRDAAGEREAESREAFRSRAATVSGLQRGAATAPQDRVQSERPPAERAARERQEELAKAAAPPPQIANLGAAGRAAQDELQRVLIAPQAALAEAAALGGERWVAADSAAIAAAFAREPIAVEGLTADTLQLAIVEGVPRARSVFVLPDGVVEMVQRPVPDTALADRAREAEADVLRTTLVIRGIEVTVRGTSVEVVRNVSARVR